jgi:mannosyl-oligosaccharide alpha-1,2-mannosidase
MLSLTLGGSAAALLLGLASAAPQPHHKPHYVVSQHRANAVKDAFQVSWDGYYKHAFPHDSLRPVTNRFADDRNGWGASAVDAFSTALVMGNWDVVNKILEYIPKINFDDTSTEVSLFETTIRYLGGLVSGKIRAGQR